MNHLTDVEKALDKIQQSFIKKTQSIRIRKELSQPDKENLQSIYNFILLNGEIQSSSIIKCKNMTSIQLCTVILAKTGKEKGIYLTDDIVVDEKNLKNLQNTRTNSEFSKDTGKKINIQKFS